MQSQPLMKMLGVTKRFGRSVLANDDINLDLYAGEVHALLGENGAGKSTLMNILYGLYAPTEGQIFMEGHEVQFSSPSDAIAAGLGMIHQEFMLIGPFTVAENLVMGTTDLPDGVDGVATAREKIRTLSAEFGLDVDPDAFIEELSVGERQRVEILKLLFRDAKVLILDEPTAVLTPLEIERFFEVLKQLRDNGRAIVIVTHKMQEVMDISDRVSVMRAGRMIETLFTKTTTPEALIRSMVGRDVDSHLERSATKERQRGLEAISLVVPRRDGEKLPPPVSFAVFHGEILGIAGVDGNGQTELFETIMGLRSAVDGAITLDKRQLTKSTCHERRELGISYIPPDRRGTGSLTSLSIENNILLGSGAEFSPKGMIDRSKLRQAADGLIERFGVRTPNAEFIAGSLSGGNLQKVILGREVARDPKVLLIEQPTRGLDVGAIELIWAEIMAQRNSGVPILMASTELEEVLALSDRIAVMFEGEIMGIVHRDEATKDLLGAMMVGNTLESLRQAEAAA